MSRLDYLTIGIIAVIVLTVIFLVYKMTDLFQTDALQTPPPVEEVTQLDSGYDDYYDEPLDSSAYEMEEVGEGSEIDYSEPEAAYEEADDAPEFSYEEESTEAAAVEYGGQYFVLAGTFSIRENADRMVARLHRMGYDQARVGIFNKGRFAGAIICCYATPKEAKAVAAQLTAQGVEAVAYRKRGQ